MGRCWSRFRPFFFVLPFSGPSLDSPCVRCRIMFDKYDTDNSDSIDAAELRDLCFNLGYYLNDEELELAMKTVDKSGDGQIIYEDFKEWWSTDDRFGSLSLDDDALEMRRQAAETFSHFDDDKSGVIEPHGGEFSALHAELTERGLTTLDEATLLQDLDTDGDGQISFNEYVAFLVRANADRIKTFIADVGPASE